MVVWSSSLSSSLSLVVKARRNAERGNDSAMDGSAVILSAPVSVVVAAPVPLLVVVLSRGCGPAARARSGLGLEPGTRATRGYSECVGVVLVIAMVLLLTLVFVS